MYDVLYNNIPIGYAKAEKVGLYYNFLCKCKFPNNEIYRIKVSDGAKERMLGVCVPEGNYFVLKTRIPVKELQSEVLCFTAEMRTENGISVVSGESFLYLDKLETARLQISNGQPRIIIE